MVWRLLKSDNTSKKNDDIFHPDSEFPGISGSDTMSIRLSMEGTLISKSASAQPLVDLLTKKPDLFRQLIETVRQTQAPAETRLSEGQAGRFWLVVVPMNDSCLFVARDTSLGDTMLEALIKSRSMLQDMLARSADLAFEVDKKGCFRFLSAKTAFGYSTENWLGYAAERIFWPDGKLPSRNPFRTFDETIIDSLPVTFGKDKKYWISFSLYPVLNEEGEATAIRGICRDVSMIVESQRKMRLDSLRLIVQQRIMTAINTADSADRLLEGTARAMMDFLRAECVWVLMNYGRNLIPVVVEGAAVPLDVDGIWEKLKKGNASKLFSFGDDPDFNHLVVHLTRPDGSTGGAVVIGRNTSSSPWSDQEKQLLDAVADTLTIALEKAQLTDALYRRASEDGLTGILNRAAMEEAVERRLRHQAGSGQSGCLIFVDLDYFKQVNDTLGHKAGDDVLKLVAHHIKSDIRPCDYAGRYGGDEFVVWLEDVNEEQAAIKARHLIDAMPGIRDKIGATNLKLSASVGIAAAIPGIDFSFEKLAERADAALYKIKHHAKSHYAIAPRPSMETGQDTDSNI